MGDSEITAQPSINEVQTDNGFVALLDVLGFKSMSDEKQQVVAALLEHACDEVLPTIWQISAERYERWLQVPVVRMFSDTIVIAFPQTKGSSVAQDQFHLVNDYLGMLFCLFLSEGLMLRGAIGYGSIIVRKYSILGSAIIDASVEYEATSWAGIHCTVCATRFVFRWHKWARETGVVDDRTLPLSDHNLNQALFYVTKVPFKQSCNRLANVPIEIAALRFTVPWPKDYRTIFATRAVLAGEYHSTHTQILGVINAEQEKTDSDRVREILCNTLGFAERYLGRFSDYNAPLIWEGPLPPLKQ
jgi:hypothetical protein